MITKVNAAGPTYEFEYSGDYQTFVVPRSGIYKLETWGAQGGDRGANNGGKGGYTTGEVSLKRGDIYMSVVQEKHKEDIMVEELSQL